MCHVMLLDQFLSHLQVPQFLHVRACLLSPSCKQISHVGLVSYPHLLQFQEFIESVEWFLLQFFYKLRVDSKQPNSCHYLIIVKICYRVRLRLPTSYWKCKILHPNPKKANLYVPSVKDELTYMHMLAQPNCVVRWLNCMMLA